MWLPLILVHFFPQRIGGKRSLLFNLQPSRTWSYHMSIHKTKRRESYVTYDRSSPPSGPTWPGSRMCTPQAGHLFTTYQNAKMSECAQTSSLWKTPQRLRLGTWHTTTGRCVQSCVGKRLVGNVGANPALQLPHKIEKAPLPPSSPSSLTVASAHATLVVTSRTVFVIRINKLDRQDARGSRPSFLLFTSSGHDLKGKKEGAQRARTCQETQSSWQRAMPSFKPDDAGLV